MFKKAKLYSLLLLVITSTALGLLSLPKQAFAQSQPSTEAKWIESQGEQTLIYNGNAYGLHVPNDSNLIDYWKNSDDFNNGENLYFTDEYIKEDGTIRIFHNIDTRSNDVAGIIYFKTPEDGDLPDDIINRSINATHVKCSGSNSSIVCNGTVTSIAIAGLASNEEIEAVEDGLEDDKTVVNKSCQIKGIGWLVCPLVNFLAEVTDASYALLDNTLLKLEPIALPGSTGEDSGMQIYDSWKTMRDIANIFFIIGFLVIVFSQITSFGISNYGIKRLLPKIIIAAILVNISYFICAFAVDLSNFLGNSLRGLLMPDGGAQLLFVGEYDPKNGEHPVKYDSTGWTGLAGIILGGVMAAGIVLAFLPVLLPLVVTAAVAVFMVVLVLTLRQALVVILIIISPLAFVALLLPNTESYFQKWRSLFTTMLMVYPIISVVFGASALASNILMTTTDDLWVQMVGAGVSVIPLALTPIIMKASGGVLNRFAGIVNDPTKGWVDGKRNALKEQGNIIGAKRKVRSINRMGNFAGRSGGIFGGANSKRRRAATLFSSYGERARKDELAAAESGIESSYIRSEGGRATRNAAENAKIDVQNAQLQADTVRLQSDEGSMLQYQSTIGEARKQTAQNEVNTTIQQSFAGSRIDRDQRTSDLQLQAAKTGADAAWAGQTIENPDLRDLTQELQENQAAISTAQGVTTRRFNKEMADGSVDVASTLGITGTSTSYGEVDKAASAIKSEAANKETQKEQQAIKTLIAKEAATAGGRDADKVISDIISSPRDDYELAGAFNEMVDRGRDGLITEQKIAFPIGTPQRELLEDAIQSYSGKIVQKSPHHVKGDSAAFDNVKGDDLAGWTKHTQTAFMEYVNDLVTSGNLAKATIVSDRFNKAMADISKSPTTKEKYNTDAGEWLMDFAKGTDPRPYRSSTPTAIDPRVTTLMSPGLANIDPRTGGIK